MTKHYPPLILLCILLIISSCSSDNNKDEYVPVSPVQVDLSKVPYATLSEYKFFEGDLKNQMPAWGVLPYEPLSQLFTDYAHKKRFVWMPEGSKAYYNGDGKILEFPTGSVLIKTFYYDEMLPNNTTHIIETRLLIKTENNWLFAEYVWNEEQTEATLMQTGDYRDIEFRENNVIKSTRYRIPSAMECATCHKQGDDPIPIGPKPQNLNSSYAYADGTKNQLSKWVDMGYLDGNYPVDISTVVDWRDTSKDLELRVRSYLDINCAHCHQSGKYCDYRPMRFAFSETNIPSNLGICVQPDQDLGNGLTQIVFPGRPQRSVLDYRINSTVEAVRMPLLGRTLVHEEATAMIAQWITELNSCD
jgi:uncharacterized repeat protein (TIGR03806 family)